MRAYLLRVGKFMAFSLLMIAASAAVILTAVAIAENFGLWGCLFAAWIVVCALSALMPDTHPGPVKGRS